MKRMVIGVVILIISIATMIMSYFIMVWPVEYIIDALLPLTPVEHQPTMISLPYFLLASLVIGIFLSFVWLWAYAHKKEYEQD